MIKLIGKDVNVFLKATGNLSGLLVDVTDDDLYIRRTYGDNLTYVIPRTNIKYCTITTYTADEIYVGEETKQVCEITGAHEDAAEGKCESVDIARVSVDGKFIANLNIPSSIFQLDRETLYGYIMQYSGLEGDLNGRAVSEVNEQDGWFDFVTTTPQNQQPPPPQQQNTFAFNSADAAGYQTGAQMAQKLSNVVKANKNIK